MPRTNFKELLDAGVHFGHLKRKWNPNMAPYIFMERNGIHIIDLQQTIVKLEEAYNLVRDTVADGGTIVFVGTKKQAAENLGIEIITGFTGSPIWNYWYSFPQTSEEMIEEGYSTIVKRWAPLFDEMDKYGKKFALEVHPTEIAYDYYTK